MTLPSINQINFQVKLFNFLLLLLVFSSTFIGSESCLLSNVSYAICSISDTNVVIQSKPFTLSDLTSECHADFTETYLYKACKNSSTATIERAKPTAAESYIYGFAAVFVVSILSLAGLFAFPLLYSVSFKYVINLFTALAVGTLFGDTMFHLIPFTLGLHSHDHNNDHSHSLWSMPDHLWKMLLSLITLYAFFLLENLLHFCSHSKHAAVHKVGHSHTLFEHDALPIQLDMDECTPMNSGAETEVVQPCYLNVANNHHHSLPQEINSQIKSNQTDNTNNNNKLECIQCSQSNDSRVNNTLVANDPNIYVQKINQCKSVSTSENSEADNKRRKKPTSSTQKSTMNVSTGWMVLVGDGIHNFADGLAIGATFSQDLVLGATTAFAIALHELPHELGDYAVLIRSGFTHCRAIFCNFLSATTAFIGFFIGVTLSSNDQMRQWILAVTIGMFMYIALVDLLPSLLVENQNDMKSFLVVNIGLLTGTLIMFLLAIFEDIFI